ncbi:hypothetical protein AHF37_10948 [Paragonimus kellicotti]|nr:hypothetical protein AHF37_10948 [Paragonimus kellicotti]
MPSGSYERKLTTVNCLQKVHASEQIQRLYNTEFADTPKFTCSQSVDDDSAVSVVKNTTQLASGHCVIPLPRRHPEMKIPNNKIFAVKRSEYLKRRFIRDSDYFLRKQWKKVPGQDDLIHRSESKACNKWVVYVTNTNPEEVSRYTTRNVADYANGAQLYVFSNASETGYGEVTHAGFSQILGQLCCAFALAGAVTLPRLELNAVVLVVRIETMIPQEFQVPFESVTYRTDSAVVSHYITDACTRFNVFVTNRIVTIHEGSLPEQWKHVRSTNNPADLTSRGIRDPIKWRTWLEGPEFPNTQDRSWFGCSPKLNAQAEIKFKSQKVSAVSPFTSRTGLNS